MNGDILRFASLKYQEKYILNPTKDRYCDIENMLNEFRSDKEPFLSMLPVDKREAVVQFSKIFRNRLGLDFYKRYAAACKSENKTAIAEVIYDDSDWVAVRNAALECIKKLGINLEEWEQAEVGNWNPNPNKNK